GRVPAVDGLSLKLATAETVGLVGESGSGKTTLGRAIVGLLPPTSGTILFRGLPFGTKGAARGHAGRSQLQMVFQDPTASLDPKWRVGARAAGPPPAGHVRSRAGGAAGGSQARWGSGAGPGHSLACPAGSGSAWGWPERSG